MRVLGDLDAPEGFCKPSGASDRSQKLGRIAGFPRNAPEIALRIHFPSFFFSQSFPSQNLDTMKLTT